MSIVFFHLFAVLVAVGYGDAVFVSPDSVEVSGIWGPSGELDEKNIINGYGLDSYDEAGLHDNNPIATTMWCAAAADKSSPAVVGDQWVIVGFDGPRDLMSMYIWNYNQAGLVERGVEDFDLYVSQTQNGDDFVQVGSTKTLAAASGGAEPVQTIALIAQDVRRVKIDILTAHSGETTGYVGLSEIAFAAPSKLQFTESDGSTTVSEDGGTDSYEVMLSRQPAAGATVEIVAVPSDAQVRLNGAEPGVIATVNFDEWDWNTPKTIGVSAVDDDLRDPDHITSVVHYISSSGDPKFDGLREGNIAVSIVDDDTCGEQGYSSMDFDEDCHVDIKDLSMFCQQWLDSTTPDMPGSVNRLVERWRDARFGLFISWGPVSQLGTEIGWTRVSWGNEIYDSQYLTFDPVLFDADEWVSIAKAAGMKYISIIAKHHDGFCIWDTKQTDYNIMNSPFGRDVCRELADACHRQGIRFSPYYSILDWYQPDYTPYRGEPGYELPPGESPNFDRYVTYMKNQLRELLENYGPCDIISFDGHWDYTWTVERGDDLDAFCRSVQPSILLNDRVGGGGTAGDYTNTEQYIGGFTMNRPWESWFTIGNQWSWRPNDSLKSLRTCLELLIKSVGGDGNFLFNVGPMPDGRIEPGQAARLKEMGDWLRYNGQSVYGTRGGPYKPGAWGVSTRKDNKIYIHILNWSQGPLVLPAINKTVLNSYLLTGGEVTVEQTPGSLTIDVAEYYRREIDTIIVLELDGPAMEIEPIDT